MGINTDHRHWKIKMTFITAIERHLMLLIFVCVLYSFFFFFSMYLDSHLVLQKLDYFFNQGVAWGGVVGELRHAEKLPRVPMAHVNGMEEKRA